MFTNLDGYFLLIIFILHAVLVCIATLIMQKRSPHNQQGVVTWIGLMALFLPIIGEVLGILAFIASKKQASNQLLADYEDYVSFNVLNLEALRHKANKSMYLMPLTEALSGEEHASGKELIVRLTNSNIKNQGRYLQLGLQNTDTDTVHYAATTMNLLIDRYEKQLQQAKEVYIGGDWDSFLNLVHTYHAYVNSGLLKGTSLLSLQNEYLRILEDEQKRFPMEMQLFMRLGELYEQLNLEQEAVSTYRYLIDTFPIEPEGYIALIRYDYGKENWHRLQDTLFHMKQAISDDQIPSSTRYIIQQLRGDLV
ncbi:hypothetical protein N781_09320 [Pontibacillus halophilus JSM 076056 = DSM 19796]|uniref:Uncharacterized protein n=1 Tax=Pontibacillus halophilus JSM 076056 = DSM 19796 TaxID=1385510 RepID=A0A0A5I0D3_9BACI|nr:hypothetical protein [Pontibacillus halophilus]KGX89312.1 hypothetical protein N781_09320 [Pontibacillus halophilus JSM 076056 = DSM 19796]